MDSLLTNLLVFINTIQQELIRSVHVYRELLLDGGEREVEREFLFSESGSYVEIQATPILTSLDLCVPQVSEGYKNGVWLCIFAFHSDHSPQFSHIPPMLLITRNPKLEAIPNLLNDLNVIYKLELNAVEKETPLLDSMLEESQGNSNDDCQRQLKVLPVNCQDQNLPLDEGTAKSVETGSVKKKKRTPSEQIAKLSLSDLAECFDLPIAEASKKLNVGLTVLKRKCREFGITRWPHRKIKSLGTLIHDLQEEAKTQELKDMEAAMAVMQRQKMLEFEKENIEKKPSMEIQNETKRFRQDVFKRRHRAKAIEKQNSTLSNASENFEET